MSGRVAPVNVSRALGSHAAELDRLKKRLHGAWWYPEDDGAYQNGWVQIPGKQKTRIRKLVHGGLEVQLAVSDGTPGSTIFPIPAEIWIPDNDGDIPGSAHDGDGIYRPYHITVDGDLVDGV